MPTTDAPDQAPGSTPTPILRRGEGWPTLTACEQQVLLFEGVRWRFAGAKETAIRTQFGWSATRRYQVLNALLDRPEAAAFAPVLVSRLRRLRDARQGARSGGRR